MKRFKSKTIIKNVLLCGFLMLFLACFSIPLKAADIEKPNKTYDIAVVFDNSGSMYKNQAWCRAKYAIEIFASMLNYENGDTLRIYPMWDVVTDGSKPDSGGSIEPVEITGKDDIEKISNLYTVRPSETPFAPVTEAYEDLKNSAADEKWLIVLTDGDFNQEARGKSAKIDLQKRLSELASEDIKVQYLGVGAAATLDPAEDRFFYAQKSSDTSLKDDLVNICNVIFRRSALPESALDGKNLTLDISMNSLIVFVQGENAKIGDLKNKDGEAVKVTLDSGLRKYSEINAGHYEDAPVDKTLSGQVVTFGACEKGEYTLEYSGADTIRIFYEPNVDIRITVTDDEGEAIDMSKSKISAGEYTMEYALVDNVTKEDVTDSALMGDDVNLTGTVIDSKGNETKVENGDKVFLQPDEATFIKVEGTYLDGYRITTEDDKDAYTFKIHTKLDADIDVRQSNSWYKLSNHEKWKPIYVKVTYDGKELSDEQMKDLDIKIDFSDPITYSYQIVPGESAFEVNLGTDEKGNYTEPATGKYKITVHVASGEAADKSSEKFRVAKYSALWYWLIRLLILLAIIALIVWWMTRKVLPKTIDIEKGSSNFRILPNPRPIQGVSAKPRYDRKAKTLRINSPSSNKPGCSSYVTFALKANDRRYKRSKDRKVLVTNISAPNNVNMVEINGTTFVRHPKNQGKFIDSNILGTTDPSAPIPPIEYKMKNATVTIGTAEGKKRLSTLECTLKHK